MDARDDTTLNWMPMAVDQAGWEEVATVFEAVANRLEAIHGLCRKRMDQSGEDAIPLVIGMAAFEPAPEGWAPDPAAVDGAGGTVGDGNGTPTT
jgi:hypothetical protein